MVYSVQKRGGVWTVATNQALLSFDSYGAAVDAAQGAAAVIRRSGTRSNQLSLLGDMPVVIHGPATSRKAAY